MNHFIIINCLSEEPKNHLNYDIFIYLLLAKKNKCFRATSQEKVTKNENFEEIIKILINLKLTFGITNS